MNKNYKVQFNTQIQTDEQGRTSRHSKAQVILPAKALADMGITPDDNLINVFYDEEKKKIILSSL